MKNVYFVQPNNSLSGSLFLPYAVGAIAAYCFDLEEIRQQYELKSLLFTKEPIETAINKFDNPYIAGFSCYMWNVEYNLALAEAVKQKFPQCIIVFGGPQIPDDTEFLTEYDFIDVLCHGEGEETFSKLLKGDEYSNISNISYRRNGEAVKNERTVSCNVDSFPSPYTSGMFDSIINNPDYIGTQFDAILETNRGCPYKCIYCCWAGSEANFRRFPIEKIKAELKWMAENRISYCICADSNFGILDRDEEIAEYIVELKKEYGYPEKFETTAAKNKDDLTFRINSKLEEAGLNRGISVAVQSMSPKVLEIVGRKNMSVDSFAQQLERYRKKNMFTYTDIILGLPGETLDSFCRGLFDVIEAGQHYSINIFRCVFLPNTIMYSKETVEKYKIKTIRSFLCQNHSRIVEDERFGSRSELVVETSTMSMAEWREAVRISACTQSFHCMGLLRFFALYLRRAKNISYYDFYTSLYRWIENESSAIKRILNTVCKSIDVFLKKQGNLSFSDRRFGDIYWSFEEGLFLSCAIELDAFYSEIRQYLDGYFDDKEVFEDLLKYQKSFITLPAKEEKTVSFKYDWCSYFEDIFDITVTEPDKKPTAVCLEKAQTDNWVDYARQIVWYGKRSDRMINKNFKII